MTAKYFVDTNILLYAVDEGAGARHEAARVILDEIPPARQKVISTQVLQEFYTAAIRKLSFAPTRARDLTMLWANLEVVRIDLEDVMGAIDCSILNRISFWDALILTSARKAHCAVLYSEDLSDGQAYDTVRVINPFR